jgi:hypothetical protein
VKLLPLLIPLALLNLLTLRLGIAWQRWTAMEHPTAVLLPLPLALSLIGCLLLERCTNFLLRIPRIRQAGLSNIYLAFLTACFSAAIYAIYATFSASRLSGGRLLLVSLWTFSAGWLSFQTTLSLDHVQIATQLRRKWVQRTLATFLGLTTCVICLLALELVCGEIISRRPTGPLKVHKGNYLEPGSFYRRDPDLGVGLEPNREVTSEFHVDKKVIWNVRYKTDEFGRRATIKPKSSDTEQLVVFFGCSYMFGEGANDDQTIPSEFVKLSDNYEAVNYGVPGWGTQQMLALLESGTARKQIPEGKRATAIYLYLQEVHESRVIGEMDVVNSFGVNFPYYKLATNGSPERIGVFSSDRWLVNNLYHVLGKSQVRAFLGLNFPRRNPSHYELTAAIIERSATLFKSQFPGSRFIVVPYPSTNPESPCLLRLKLRGVPVEGSRTLFQHTDPAWHHFGDGHPTPLANKAIAKQIVQLIGKDATKSKD